MHTEKHMLMRAASERWGSRYRCRPEVTYGPQRWRPGCDLSPHELRLLSLLVDGHNLKTAAAELSVSRATVAWHMRNIYVKLQVHSKSEAVGKALRYGLIN